MTFYSGEIDASAVKPVVFVVSGPSGSGKETAISHLREDFSIPRVLTATTRSPRDGEVPGQQYEFITDEDFVKRAQQGDFFEYARTYGTHAYASPSSLLSEEGAPRECIIELDPQGFVELRARSKRRVVGIFVLPPSLRELRRRILARAPVENLDARLITAAKQFVYANLYDYVVVNDSAENMFDFLDSVLRVERELGIASTTARQLLNESREADVNLMEGSD